VQSAGPRLFTRVRRWVGKSAAVPLTQTGFGTDGESVGGMSFNWRPRSAATSNPGRRWGRCRWLTWEE